MHLWSFKFCTQKLSHALAVIDLLEHLSHTMECAVKNSKQTADVGQFFAVANGVLVSLCKTQLISSQWYSHYHPNLGESFSVCNTNKTSSQGYSKSFLSPVLKVALSWFPITLQQWALPEIVYHSPETDSQSQHTCNSFKVRCLEMPSFCVGSVLSPVTHNVSDRAPAVAYHVMAVDIIQSAVCL